MKRNFIYKLLVSSCLVFFAQMVTSAKDVSFVSLSPALTEIIYAIGAQDSLKGVSTACSYPEDAKNKVIVGDNYFVNAEKIISLKPNYIIAPDSSVFVTDKFRRFDIEPLCFKNQDIESIKQNIIKLGELSGKIQNAEKVVEDIDKKILSANKNHNHKILYLVQTEPMITIGKKSFITDIIYKSGNKSITSDIDAFYPTISEEYAILMQPDVVVLSFFSDAKRIKKLFPKSRIITMTEEENDIVNRPGARVYKSVEFFAQF